jgi:two-component system, NarL family, sensor histidine kinase UhpB
MIFMNRGIPQQPLARSLDTIASVRPFTMSLRLKINLIVAALTLLFAAMVLALQLRSMRESVHEEVIAANRVASLFLKGTVWRYAAQGMPATLAFLQSIGRVRSNEITLYDAKGETLYRSPPSPYKAGRDAPDWFSEMIAPPPSVQSIELPDGKLVVRANSSRAEIDAWDYVVALVGGAVGLLIAVNVAVFWLVGRAVKPFGQIAHALDELQAGRFETALPPLPGTEAAAIGAAFNRMVGQLQTHLETERRAVRAELQLSDSRELTHWIDQHVQQERRMIARELHDELGQSVTGIRSIALSIATRMRALDATSEAAALSIAEESSRLYDAMHGIIPRLTPLVLDNFGLADALGDLVERTRRSHAETTIELAVQLDGAVLDADASLMLYRAAQEGLSNALRHGHATRIALAVRGGEGGHDEHSGVTLELIDDGIGLAPDWSQRDGHYGLRWLGERVQSLGGRFEIGAVPPRGVRLLVSLPAPMPLPMPLTTLPTTTAEATP